MGSKCLGSNCHRGASVVREQVSGEQLSLGSKYHRGASFTEASVWGATVTGEQVSSGSKCHGSKCLGRNSLTGEQVSSGSKCHGSKCLGSNCRWGASVRRATVTGASVWGAPFVDSQNKYQEDKCFYLNVKKLLALSFVPVSDVIKAFELIVNDFDDDADDFLGYFEKTWIGEPKRRGKAHCEKKHLIITYDLGTG